MFQAHEQSTPYGKVGSRARASYLHQRMVTQGKAAKFPYRLARYKLAAPGLRVLCQLTNLVPQIFSLCFLSRWLPMIMGIRAGWKYVYLQF